MSPGWSCGAAHWCARMAATQQHRRAACLRELGLDGHAVRQHPQVVSQLVVGGDDDAWAHQEGVGEAQGCEGRSTGSPAHTQWVARARAAGRLTLAAVLKLRAPSTAEDLLHIQHACGARGRGECRVTHAGKTSHAPRLSFAPPLSLRLLLPQPAHPGL